MSTSFQARVNFFRFLRQLLRISKGSTSISLSCEIEVEQRDDIVHQAFFEPRRDIEALVARARAFPGLVGQDLAKQRGH